MGLELDLEMLLALPFWTDLKLLQLSSWGLLEANPERLLPGDGLLVADLVPYLGEGLPGQLPDRQSDRLDMNMNSSK